MWSRRIDILCPVDAPSDVQLDAIAQAYVTVAGLESFANERKFWERALRRSDDYGATETHRRISTAATAELAAALKLVLEAISGAQYYICDADSGDLLDTNDTAKKTGDVITAGLEWTEDTPVAAGEVVSYGGVLWQCIQAHTTQANWQPPGVPALFREFVLPGVVRDWKQPLGAHDAYPIGARVLYAGDVWINEQAANAFAPGTTGWVNENAPAPEVWTAGVAYKTGDEVLYGGVAYRCRQGHTSQAGWEPPNVPALWETV